MEQRWETLIGDLKSGTVNVIVCQIHSEVLLEINKKRKLKDVIRGMISDGFCGTQAQLVKLLRAKGIEVSQSTVSRTIRQMSVIKKYKNGRATYAIQPYKFPQYRGSLSDLIVNIENNESMIIVKTIPGSAMFVAGFIDHECSKQILGSIAGDDTIFVAPKNIIKINYICKELGTILKNK